MKYNYYMKKNITLLIAIAMPIIFIVIISIVVFVPPLFLKPQYNFLYTTNNDYYDYNGRYKNSYSIKDNKLVSIPVTVVSGVSYKEEQMPLYIYDVKSNTTKQVSFDEVGEYVIDSGPSSPDGYIVKYDYNYGDYGIFGLFGSGRRSNGYVIAKNDNQKQLTGLTSDGYSNYYYQFKFIGWIK